MCQRYTKKSYTGDDIQVLFRRVEWLEEAVQERQVVVDKRLTNLCYRIDGLEQSTKKDVDEELHIIKTRIRDSGTSEFEERGRDDKT